MAIQVIGSAAKQFKEKYKNQHSENYEDIIIDNKIKYEFNIILKDEKKLNFEVKQLSYNEFHNLFFALQLLNNIFSSIQSQENSDQKKTDVSKIFKNIHLSIYLMKMSKCINPDLVIPKQILKIQNIEYKEELTKRDYLYLIKELENYNILNYNNNHKFNLFNRYKKVRELNKSSEKIGQLLLQSGGGVK